MNTCILYNTKFVCTLILSIRKFMHKDLAILGFLFRENSLWYRYYVLNTRYKSNVPKINWNFIFKKIRTKPYKRTGKRNFRKVMSSDRLFLCIGFSSYSILLYFYDILSNSDVHYMLPVLLLLSLIGKMWWLIG